MASIAPAAGPGPRAPVGRRDCVSILRHRAATEERRTAQGGYSRPRRPGRRAERRDSAQRVRAAKPVEDWDGVPEGRTHMLGGLWLSASCARRETDGTCSRGIRRCGRASEPFLAQLAHEGQRLEREDRCGASRRTCSRCCCSTRILRSRQSQPPQPGSPTTSCARTSSSAAWMLVVLGPLFAST